LILNHPHPSRLRRDTPDQVRGRPFPAREGPRGKEKRATGKDQT
jgi:hypothetical protein